MNDEEKKDFARSLVEAIREEWQPFAISHETHAEHHEYIRAWIEKQKAKSERWDKIRVQVSGWVIVSVLAGIGTGAYTLVNSYFKDHMK